MSSMSTIGWLHVTDLHFGMTGITTAWPTFRADLERDLEELHEVSGPWQIVLFTGDLTQKGAPGDFEALDGELDRLWERFLKLQGSEPVLFAVPGNHDLLRPPESLPVVQALQSFCTNDKVRELFWSADAANPYRDVVLKAFEPYERWHRRFRQRHPLPGWVTERRGLLPGDFAATVRRDGLTLGIIGLNTAFLQLSAGDYESRLDLDPRQLLAVSDGEPQDWADNHHLCLLMTHHPPEWLSLESQARYRGEVTAGSRFFAHLCGHLHEPRATSMRIAGAPMRRQIQGASLFGLETWTDRGGLHEQRIHGYSAARLEAASGRATFHVFPRISKVIQQAGTRRLVADSDHFVLRREAWSEEVDLRSPQMARFARTAAASGLPPSFAIRRAPQPPGLRYDADWYVRREHEERLALAALNMPGTPAILTSADLCGKSTMIQQLVTTIRQDEAKRGQPVVVAIVDFSTLAPGLLADTDLLFRELAQRIVDACERDLRVTDAGDWVDLAWRRPGTPERKLTVLLQRRVLDPRVARVVVVFDRVDLIIGHAPAHALFRMLREWQDQAGDDPWSRLRLLLAVSSAKMFFESADPVSEFFNLIAQVQIHNFRPSELMELGRLYDRSWSESDIAQLLDLVDGQPYLSRLVMYLEALGTPKNELLDLERMKNDFCANFLRQLWLRLQTLPLITQPLSVLVKNPGAELHDDQYARLRRAGLVRREGTRYRVSNRLYESYFRERC